MKCPGCGEQMVEQSFQGLGGQPLLLDICPGCHGLWFDTQESRQLSPGGTLRLFRELHGRRDAHRNRVADALRCVRCPSPLARTHDLAHNQRFQYSRCPQGHGHFITFFQFLREKGIVRGLNARELTELRKHVDTLLCSDCGTPIEVATQSACAHCHAPLSILDPHCVEDTVLKAQQAVGSRHEVAPEMAARLLMNNLRMDGFHRRPTPRAQPASNVVLPIAAASGVQEREHHSMMDKAEFAADSVDLLDLGVDLVVGGLESLGDLFSW